MYGTEEHLKWGRFFIGACTRMNAQQTRTKFRLPATPLHPLPVPKHIAIHNRTCVTFRKGWVSNNPLHGFVVTSEFQHCHICKILKSLKCMRVSGNKKMRAATSTAFIHLSTSQIDPRDGSGRVAYGRIGLRREFVCLLRVRFVIFFNCVRVDVFFEWIESGHIHCRRQSQKCMVNPSAGTSRV